MKNLVLLFAGIILTISSFAVHAQQPQKLNIEQATVFLSGAELVSTAYISVSKGENEVVFSNVAGDVNQQSIVVKATNGLIVESVTFQNNYLNTDNLSPKAKALKDSIEFVTQERAMTNVKLSVVNQQLGVIENNKKVNGENTGLSVAELQKLLDLINNKMEVMLTRQIKLTDSLKKTDERIARLKKQLNQEQKKDYQPGGQLLIKFHADNATASNISISYIVPNAGWTPTYDIWADDIHSPIKLYYKANIYQNSGVKWNNVHLMLSTGNPYENMQSPTITPQYLAFYVPIATTTAYSMPMQRTKNSQYIIDGVQVQSQMGYDQSDLDKSKEEKAKPDEQASINNYVSIDNSGVNTSFDIDLPYTIPSDGQQHLVAVKKYDVPATYRYFAIPKVDKDAFLQAQISNWEDLNLLPGKSNIFYEGTYVGQGNIDMRNVKDTMNISLGRDKKIVIKRERDKKLRSVHYIGSNVRETYNYNITIRNTRKEKIDLTIQDQYPVSNDKDIVIEDKDNGNAGYDETTGLLTWTLSVDPNAALIKSFGFTVKYPKGKVLTGLPR